MKTTLSLLAILSFYATALKAQEAGAWETVADSPFAFKHDDIHFSSRLVGIAVGFESIYMTFDGGETWQRKHQNRSRRFRAATMINDSTAVVGSLDTNTILRTTDAGETWESISTGGPGVGICGLFKIDDDTIYGVGRYTGNARFLVSKDKGATWTVQDLVDYLAGAIDLHFWDDQHGIVLGRTDNSSQIIKTTNGGRSWNVVYDSGRPNEWGWKLSFPSEMKGFASISRAANIPTAQEYILKTWDGGDTWTEIEFWSNPRNDPPYVIQAIGFVNEQVGWVGSYNGYPTLVTEDGGQSWREAGWGNRVNRLRFFGDSLAFASGEELYRSRQPVIPVSTSEERPNKMDVSIYPNPSRDFFRLDYKSKRKGALLFVNIFDLFGRKVRSMDMESNNHPITVPTSGLSKGSYLVEIRDGPDIFSKILLKQ